MKTETQPDYVFPITGSLSTEETVQIAKEHKAHSLALIAISGANQSAARVGSWFRRHYLGVVAVNGQPNPLAAVIIQGTRLVQGNSKFGIPYDFARTQQQLQANLSATYLRLGTFMNELSQLAEQEGIKVVHPRGRPRDISLCHQYCSKRRLMVPAYLLNEFVDLALPTK